MRDGSNPNSGPPAGASRCCLQFGDAALDGVTHPADDVTERLGLFLGWHGQTLLDRPEQILTPALGKLVRHHRLDRPAGGGQRRQLDKGFMTQNEIRRSVRGDGFLFPPTPDFPEYGESRTVEAVAAFQSPDQIRVGRPPLAAVAGQARAGFPLPAQAIPGFQIGFQTIGQRLQVMGVVARVGFHPFGQRPPRPIGFLRAFVEGHAKVFGHEMCETELAVSEQTAGQHGVEDGARGTKS